MHETQFYTVIPCPRLLNEIRHVLEPCGWHAESLAPVGLEDLAHVRLGESHFGASPHYKDVIIQLERFDQFDEVMAILYGDARRVELENYLRVLQIMPGSLPCWPRFLIPKVASGDPDIRTFLGSDYSIAYSRWNLDDIFGVEVLSNFALYDSDATLIRRLVRGSDLLKLQQLRRQFEHSIDCERLAELAEAAIMASRHASTPSEPVGFKAITRMCELRHDYLKRAAILAVGSGLAQVYETPWWSNVERISLERLCAGVGLKRDKCGEPEVQLWTRIRHDLTRIDRWYDLPEEGRDDEDDEAVLPRRSAPPSISEVVSQAIKAAQDRLPRVFAELQLQRDLVESYADERPVLVAREVQGGWLLRYLERGNPLREISITEKPGPEKSGRLTRFLLPMMEKMRRDIEANIEVSECGWVPIQQIDPQSATETSEKFRKDKSDLTRELLKIGLEIESNEGKRKIRIDRCLADNRAHIEVLRR
jgi:hypothetical protein